MSEERQPMKFVVKGTTPSRDVVWLSLPDSDGFRNLGPLQTAEEFQDKSDARLAIAEMPRPFRDAGFFFWVMTVPTDADKKRLHEITMRALGEARASEDVKCLILRMLNDE
jgi:hypothetical protein